MIHRRFLAFVLPALVALGALAPASAFGASQTITDASGEARNDVTEAGFDHDGANVTFRFAVPYAAWTGGYNDEVVAFLDTNGDNRSDYAIRAFSGASTSMDLSSTPQSTTDCQKGTTGATSLTSGNVATVQDGSLARIAWTIPATSIGGASTFRWGVYAKSFSVFNNSFDYLPDAANPSPARPNPVTTVNDRCDTNGDGQFNDSDAGGGARDLPMLMGNGIGFPDGTGGGGGGTPTPTPTTPTPTPTPTPAPAPGTPAQHATTFAGSIPKLTGKRLDLAREALDKAGITNYVLKTTWARKASAKAAIGSVLKQSPKPGTKVDGDLRDPVNVTLAIKKATKVTNTRKGCGSTALVKAVKGAELPLATTLLKQAGCKTKFEFTVAKTDDMVSRVLKAQGRAVTLKVSCPTSTDEQDLFAFFREIKQDLSFGPEWALTVSPRTPNSVSISVLQRGAFVDANGRLGGQFVQNAKVYVDGSDVDARDVVAMPTNSSGATAFQITARKAGTVDICLVAEDRHGEALYGAAQLRAVERAQNRFLTISGRDMARAANGSWNETDLPGPEYVRGAQAPDHFSQLVSAIQNLLTGFSGQVVNVFNANAPARNKLVTATKRLGFSPGQFAFGQTVGPTTKVVGITRDTGLIGQAGSNIISDKGMGVISTEGGNVVAAGGPNLIGDNGSALIGQAGSNYGIPTGGGGGLAGVVNVSRAQIVEIGGHRIISDNGLGLVAPSAQAICAGGYN